ncbi:MAG: DUF1631 family protein [Ramlibacter sp.]
MSGPSHPSPYQAAYRACIKDAAADGSALLRATLARALEDLPRHAAGLPDVVERNLLLDAVAVLREQQHALAEAFPTALLAEFAQAIAGDRASTLGFDALPLLGDEQLQENVDLVRAAQKLQELVQPQLADLETLLGAARLAGATGHRHPLRPEVYVRSLYRLARQSPVSASVRRRWLRHLPPAMGPELARSYAVWTAALQAQGLGAGQPARQAAAAPQEPADQAIQLTIRELRKLLAGEPPALAAAVSAPDTEFAHTVPAALQVLHDMRKVDQVLQQLRQRQAAVPGRPADSRALFREALRREAKRPAQALGLEVVHLMVENLAGDVRLLPPVQEAVRDLEPALLRLALEDPRFFSDRAHPARQLLEQVTERSLGWGSTDAPGFREFVDGLQEAVEALLETRATGAQPFEIALETLRESWTDAQPRGRRGRERAVRALLRAEQRNLLADRIAAHVRERPDAQAAPDEALAFLCGPWAQVMAQARLTDESGSEDPGGYAAVVPLLLWSVQPGLAARVGAQQDLVDEAIAAGLASIDHPPAETQRWQAVLRQLRGVAIGLASGTGAALPALAPVPPRSPTWLAPGEAHDSGFVPEQVLAFGTAPWEPDTLPPVDLEPGAWVELLGEAGESARWQLSWASPHGLLFMFTHASGASRSMTRRRLQQMLAEGALRLVSTRAVVDGALDAVAHEAWRNSLYHQDSQG